MHKFSIDPLRGIGNSRHQTNAILSSFASNRNVSDGKRRVIYDSLLEKSNDRKLPKGTITSVAYEHHVSNKTVSRIWHCGQKSLKDSAPAAKVSSQSKENCDRKQINSKNLQSSVEKHPFQYK